MILDQTIATKIKEQYDILLEKREVLPDEELAVYYRTFRQKFGPERLAGLDGEELLNLMHNSSNHDSLVYWLEFKNDEEYPYRFGSIAGGSALKFGIYRRKETGSWVTGSPAKQEQLTINQAIQIARRNRDQLLAGCKLLEELPVKANSVEYAKLQANMEILSPNTSNTAWGHKYFHMLFPDKLDDFHNDDFQRFYLIKLLQIPVAKQVRYANAGQYMDIARELGMHVNNLTRILNELNGKPHRYWSVKANYQNKNWKNWETMRDGGFIGIGWHELGDLSDILYKQESLDKIKAMMKEKYNEKGGFAHEIFYFVAVMTEGDIVLATEHGGKVLGVGRVMGDYYYTPETDLGNRYRVEWLQVNAWELPIDEIKSRVVRQLSLPENLVDIEKHILGVSAYPVTEIQITEKLPEISGVIGHTNEVLERKRQVILYGPPGTGKTHWAYQAAITISAYHTYGQDFSTLPDEQQTTIIGKDQVMGFVRFCTFHPSYGYEDFIEGYKPKTDQGTLVFEQRAGIFKKICQDAYQQPERKFFLIIDEINRGDIPRIFGELLTILEKDKRGRALCLPVSGDAFSVPDNVYIIGTMNTADRSIALLDTALRRRFGFIELMPDPSILGTTTVEGIPLGPWLEALNQRILQSIGRDARNLQVGHAYFLENGQPLTDFSRFLHILQDDIIPLLEEYCYEDYETLEKILGKGLVDRERQRVRDELFELSRRDNLVQALLEPSPEITASSAAVQQDQSVETDENDLEEQA